MKCIHCGQEIENDSRFCAFCGGENQPQAAAQPVQPMPQEPPRPNIQPMAPMGYPQMPKQKQVGAGKWVLVCVWLALVIVGWVAVLLLLQSHPAEAVANEKDVWYQWDLSSDTLYSWTFNEDGTAEYGIPGKNERSTVEYSTDDSGALHIGYDDEAVVWEYDSLENCYWQYTVVGGQTYKTRIFRSSAYPAGNAVCYSYRTNDDVSAPVSSSYENIAELSADAAEEILGWYNWYCSFGACLNMESVSGQEAEEALRSAGYDPVSYRLYRVTCCNSIEQSREHLAHYLTDDILNGKYRPEALPVEYNGQLYMAVVPTGYFSYRIDGEVTDLGNGKWSVPLRIEEEGDIFRGYTAIFRKENGTIKLVGVENGNAGGEMTEWDAQVILNWYNQYESFGACCSTVGVSQEIADAVLLSAGYESQYLDMYYVSRVVCCHSLEQSREHLSCYLGEDILNSQKSYEAKPIEYNGGLYTVAAPMGYPGYHMDGSLTDQGEGVWTVPVKMDYEDTPYTAFFKLENGTYKLISIENAGGPDH